MRALALPLLLLFTAGCSPLYVVRAAYEQGKILLNREEIAEVLQDEGRPAEERSKLRLVLDAREFGLSRIGLTPGESFTKYTKMEKDTLAWVVVASKPDSFNLYTWWFPIVGRVPYKGYFSKDDADSMAVTLQAEGYESWVRGTEAMSTLGWFNDPVLSTTLKNEPPRIVNTVIHESLHSTLWIKDHVDFNESLANFVGGKGMFQFYRDRAQKCAGECAEERRLETAACKALQGDLTLAAGVEGLYRELDTLYRSAVSSEEKLRQRIEIFDQRVGALKLQFPRMTVLSKVNNAELIQLKLYMTDLMAFEAMYRSNSGSWEKFLAEMRRISEEISNDRKLNPFDLLKSRVPAVLDTINDEVCS